jgi:hypothetical protein
LEVEYRAAGLQQVKIKTKFVVMEVEYRAAGLQQVKIKTIFCSNRGRISGSRAATG